jgi:hypothetical protein
MVAGEVERWAEAAQQAAKQSSTRPILSELRKPWAELDKMPSLLGSPICWTWPRAPSRGRPKETESLSGGDVKTKNRFGVQ